MRPLIILRLTVKLNVCTNCTVLLEFNTFQSQLTLLFYTACLFTYFSCPWAVSLVQYLLVVFFFFVINVFQAMDSSSRRLRSQVPEASEGPTHLDLFKLIQSVEKRLTGRLTLIENDLKLRLCAAETPLENAHEKILSLETDLTKLRDEIASFKEEKR